MNINITFCIQCLNFFVTYLFLRYLLFKPVIKIILKEEELQANTEHEIAQQKAYLAEQFNQRQLHWQKFKTYCQFNKPIIEDLTESTKNDSFIIPEMSENPALTKTMSEKYAKLIIEHLKI